MKIAILILISVVSFQSFAVEKSLIQKAKGSRLYSSCQIQSCVTEAGKKCLPSSEDFFVVSSKMDLFLNVSENSKGHTIMADQTLRTLLFFDEILKASENNYPRFNGPLMIRESALENGSTPVAKDRQLTTSFIFMEDSENGDISIKIHLQKEKGEVDKLVAIYTQKERTKTAIYTCLNVAVFQTAFE